MILVAFICYLIAAIIFFLRAILIVSTTRVELISAGLFFLTLGTILETLAHGVK